MPTWGKGEGKCGTCTVSLWTRTHWVGSMLLKLIFKLLHDVPLPSLDSSSTIYCFICEAPAISKYLLLPTHVILFQALWLYSCSFHPPPFLADSCFLFKAQLGHFLSGEDFSDLSSPALLFQDTLSTLCFLVKLS